MSRKIVSQSKTLSTVEALMTENSRLKQELEQAIKRVMPPSYITQDVMRECLDIFRSLGLGKNRRPNESSVDTEFRDMVLEAYNAYQKIHKDNAVYKLDYETIYKKFQMVAQAAEGVEVAKLPQGPIDNVVNKVANQRAVLEMIAVRLERWRERDPDLGKLREDVVNYLEGKKAA